MSINDDELSSLAESAHREWANGDREDTIEQLEAEIARLRTEVKRLDDGETQAIKQRDHAEKIIDKLCETVLGSEREEWSSAYYYEDAVEEVACELQEIRKAAKRYLWLRNSAVNGTRHDPAVLRDGPTDECDFMFGDELDAAIDAAMGADA